MPSRFSGGISVRNRKYLPVNTTGTTVLDYAPKVELVLREMVIPLNFADGTAEVATNFKFPGAPGVVVLEEFINVITAEATGATKTLSLGTATADSGIPNLFLNAVDVSATGLVGVQDTKPQTITVTASPFAYTSPGSQVVTITGGTTTHVTLTRNGVATADLATASPFSIYLSDQDLLTVTYSAGAPTMLGFGTVEADAYIDNVNSKRVSWTPGSSDWANFVGEAIVRYYIVNDTSQFQNALAEVPLQGEGI